MTYEADSEHHVESWRSDVDGSFGWTCFTCGWTGLDCPSWQFADREGQRHANEHARAVASSEGVTS